MNELLGYIAGISFALAGAPQAYKCYKQGHAHGVSKAMLYLWIIGEVSAIFYTLHLWREILPIFINYFLNLAIISVIVKYRFWPSRRKED